MADVPASIKVIRDWGEVIFYVEDDDRFVAGNHLLVEGSEEDILAWFKSVPWVWMQVPGTRPINQKFEQWHF